MTTDNQSEARRLKATGIPVVAMDGTQYRIIYDMDAIGQLEEDFGSLGGMQDLLNEMFSDKENTKFVQPMTKMIRAGLMHDVNAQSAMFDMDDFASNMSQVITAMRLYFPKEVKGTKLPTVVTPPTTSDSPGISSITQQPSSSDEQTINSGE
jgi:hypothetical protein